jgi:hypothetical protein
MEAEAPLPPRRLGGTGNLKQADQHIQDIVDEVNRVILIENSYNQHEISFTFSAQTGS